MATLSFIRYLQYAATQNVHDWLMAKLGDIGAPVKSIELKAKTVRINATPRTSSVSLPYDDFDGLLEYSEEERNLLIRQVLTEPDADPRTAYLVTFLGATDLPLLLTGRDARYWIALRTVLWYSIKRNRPIPGMTATLLDNLKNFWEQNETGAFSISSYSPLEYVGGYSTPSGATFAAFELFAYPTVYENVMKADYQWLAQVACDTLKVDQLERLCMNNDKLRTAVQDLQENPTPPKVTSVQAPAKAAAKATTAELQKRNSELSAALSAAVAEQQQTTRHAQNLSERVDELEKQVADLRKLLAQPVRLRLNRLKDNQVIRGELTALGQKIGVE